MFRPQIEWPHPSEEAKVRHLQDSDHFWELLDSRMGRLTVQQVLRTKVDVDAAMEAGDEPVENSLF